jgi:hypothetical protein
VVGELLVVTAAFLFVISIPNQLRAGGMLLLEKGTGSYRGVHLDTREVYEMEGNLDLEKRYRMKTP